MNEYNSILCIPVGCFFNALLTKKKLTPNALKTGAGGLTGGHFKRRPVSRDKAGTALDKSSSILAIACFVFLFKEVFHFFFQIFHERWGEVKNFARVSSVFAKLMRLSSRLQLFHQSWVRQQTGIPTAGHQL